MKKSSIIFLLSLVSTIFTVNAATPADILKRATDKAYSAKGIKGTFSMTGNGQTLPGTLSASGVKFHITTDSYSVWYNGKNMWSYNPASKETTLTVPSQSELRETNPLEYLKSYSKEYTAKFASTKIAGKYIIDLVPISRKSSMKNIRITLNSGTLKPERFEITAKNNSKTTIVVKSLNYNSAIKPDLFEYPKSKYPKAEIIDLR